MEARLFALLDANAGPGQADHVSVFDTVGGTTSGTPLLRAFLQERALCLPCTSPCHEGPHTTWVAPDGLSEHVIDYIAIPRTSLQECLFSKVVEELDLGNSHHDHSAIAIQLQWQETRIKQPHTVSHQKVRIDYDNLQGHHVRQALHDYVVPAWKEDIELQVSHFNDHVLGSLQQICPRTKQKPKKPCIDDATWHHRTQKLIARRGLRQLAKHCRGEMLRACFSAWHSQTDYDIDRFWQYRRWLLCANVKLMARHSIHARQLKRRLQDRKSAYLRQV